MAVLAWWVLGSGSALVALLIVFQVEETRGQRFWPIARRTLDQAVVRFNQLVGKITPHWRGETLRVKLLFYSNQLLHLMQRWFLRGAAYIVRLEERNRRTARTLTQAREATHLDAMREHKAETALSPKERERLKRQMLEG